MLCLGSWYIKISPKLRIFDAIGINLMSIDIRAKRIRPNALTTYSRDMFSKSLSVRQNIGLYIEQNAMFNHQSKSAIKKPISTIKLIIHIDRIVERENYKKTHHLHNSCTRRWRIFYVDI